LDWLNKRILAVGGDLFAVHAKMKLRHAMDLGGLCGFASLAPKPLLKQILCDFMGAHSKILPDRA
jgi:hypothetical protein